MLRPRSPALGARESSSEAMNHPFPLSFQLQRQTLDPCVVLMKELIDQYRDLWHDRGGVYSLAQGIVYWDPPVESVVAALEQEIQNMKSSESSLHTYGPNEGLPSLRAALHDKISRKNHLPHHQVMVTMGANQAYMNVVLTLPTATTTPSVPAETQMQHKAVTLSPAVAVVFAPYYFNHVMALQMTLSDPENQLRIGPTCARTGYPNVDWLKQEFQRDTIRMVTITNPCNPTGVYIPRAYLQQIVDLCRQHSAWLVLDCTYEHFVHQDDKDSDATSSSETVPPMPGAITSPTFDGCFPDSHVIHIFSFSKAYALAGYRCGYIVLPKDAPHLWDQMMKVQDTIPISPSRISQIVALAALQQDPTWVPAKVQSLQVGRRAIRQALSVLEEMADDAATVVTGGTGAMYYMARLPPATLDVEFCTKLVRDYGVAVIPGSFCGAPGTIRVCYANLPPQQCLLAASRLARGLKSLQAKEEKSLLVESS
jgi:aromatic aminotransferase